MIGFPSIFFLPGRNDPKRREAPELDKGAMVGVNGRLKREATSYPARVEREDLFFCFVILFSLTLTDREAGLFFHYLFYNTFIYYTTRFFLLLYIY